MQLDSQALITNPRHYKQYSAYGSGAQGALGASMLFSPLEVRNNLRKCKFLNTQLPLVHPKEEHLIQMSFHFIVVPLETYLNFISFEKLTGCIINQILPCICYG